MSLQLNFHDTGAVRPPRLASWLSPAQGPVRAGCSSRSGMAPSPISNSSQAVALAAASVGAGLWRVALVVAPQLAALLVLILTEVDTISRTAFLLSWMALNLGLIALTRRPAISGALALGMLTVLILLSRLKYDVVQMTVNFIDVMMIDRASAAYLFTIFPTLWQPVSLALLIGRAARLRALALRSVPHPKALCRRRQRRGDGPARRAVADLAARPLGRLLQQRLPVEVRALRRQLRRRLHAVRISGIRQRRRRSPCDPARGDVQSRRPASAHRHDP